MGTFLDADLEADRTYGCRRIPPAILAQMITNAARGNKELNQLSAKLRNADAMLKRMFRNGGSQKWQHACAHLNSLGVRLMRKLGLEFYALRQNVEDQISAEMLGEIPCDAQKGFGWSYMFGTQCPPMVNGIHLDITTHGGNKLFEIYFMSYDMTDSSGSKRRCGEAFSAPISQTLQEPLVQDNDLLEVFVWSPGDRIPENQPVQLRHYAEFKKGWNGRVHGDYTSFGEGRIVFRDKLGVDTEERGLGLRDSQLLIRVINRTVP